MLMVIISCKVKNNNNERWENYIILLLMYYDIWHFIFLSALLFQINILPLLPNFRLIICEFKVLFKDLYRV